MWSEQTIGLVLAISSSVFIGSSFIIKKRGLRMAGSSGLRAGSGGFGYLREPIWWAGLLTMVVGEIANFAAYAFAPAILVTPLGALSIIISALLADQILNEKLNVFGWVGCGLCINGSITIVLHAPAERPLTSVLEVWEMAMQPAFILYASAAALTVIYLIYWVAPKSGTTNIFVYLGICSTAGSLSVISCKALGIAVKLTFQGNNQLLDPHTLVFIVVLASCLLTQIDYLNRALDLYNTAVVSPIYYVMFTLLSIVASVIMFQDVQTSVQLATEACGFLTIVGGTFLLHTTRDLDLTPLDLDHLTKGERDSAATAAAARTTSGALPQPSLRGRRVAAAQSLELAGGGGGKHLALELGGGGGGDAAAAAGEREDEPLIGNSSSRKR
ncbi:MAG: magnesium transporter NIPA-domain-containing protein [Monoraphidium minutum]|nr:MAG: magnesium transporter NIPA-domain-containing protein [Monoraphidium minutum]